MWLSGTHVSGWKDGKWLQNWVKYGDRKPSRDKVELFNIDFKSIVTDAADKIDTMFWFGIMEDLERSLELLAFQLGYEKKVDFLRKILDKTMAFLPYFMIKFLDKFRAFAQNGEACSAHDRRYSKDFVPNATRHMDLQLRSVGFQR